MSLKDCEQYHKFIAESRAQPEPEKWSSSWDEYFAPLDECHVVAAMRQVLPEAVVSRAKVQEMLMIADGDTQKAADLLTTDPTVVLHWKIITVCLRVKKVVNSKG